MHHAIDRHLVEGRFITLASLLQDREQEEVQWHLHGGVYPIVSVEMPFMPKIYGRDTTCSALTKARVLIDLLPRMP